MPAAGASAAERESLRFLRGVAGEAAAGAAVAVEVRERKRQGCYRIKKRTAEGAAGTFTAVVAVGTAAAELAVHHLASGERAGAADAAGADGWGSGTDGLGEASLEVLGADCHSGSVKEIQDCYRAATYRWARHHGRRGARSPA